MHGGFKRSHSCLSRPAISWHAVGSHRSTSPCSCCRWATWCSETRECIDGPGGRYHDYDCAAWAGVPLWTVTGTRVQGAVAAYLCLGFAWADAYHIVALADPNAFNAAGTDVSVALNWMNYSFGMLTTIGYAGIVPIDSVAHTLCSAEAVTGQLYLAVLVARLVSMHVGAEEKSKQERLV
jgi:hypothetical protein